MQVFIGAVAMFGFSFAPKNWALAQGQLMAIQQNSALFSLLGTTFGGNGVQTFGLPDLRSRISLGQGNSTTGNSYIMGEFSGMPSTTLLSINLPQHTHGLNASSVAGATSTPAAGQVIGAVSGEDANLGAVTVKVYAPAPANTMLSPQAVALAGGSQPTPIVQPYDVINSAIALYGIYPSRN